jgi:hypothetical protein
MPHTAQSGYRRHIFCSGLSVESLVDIRDPGIGVRVSIYIQAFLILVPGALKFVELIAVYDRVLSDEKEFRKHTSGGSTNPGSEELKLDLLTLNFASQMKSLARVLEAVEMTDVHRMMYPSLFLGYALIISSVVQARTGGLTVYHAIIVLNLNWIIILGVMPCFLLSCHRHDAKIWRSVSFFISLGRQALSYCGYFEQLRHMSR